AVALGATRWQAVRRVLLPAARSGLATAVVLGLGRAVGETMAVLMVTGNVAAVPRSPLDPARTLTGNIAMEMGYAVGRHREALFAAGVLLLALVMAVNAAARRVGR
ncbi:MAG TPA: ABC transporter permease subunit, partial [Symbiobacteriaceae bacterium]|nr:ABC transporter permease subunit [Symbiobacteriaceae bacterium]